MAAKGWRKRNTHIPDAKKMVEGVKDSLTTQQEQGSTTCDKPVAKYIGEDWAGSLVSLYEDIPLNTFLYTAPPSMKCEGPQQRKPLTDEQIEEVWRNVQANDFHDCVQPFARAIEAAHGIKG